MLWTPSRRNAGRIDCFDLFSNFAIPKATLAQSVEQRIRNAQVASSSLVSGSKRQPSGCLFSLYTGAAAPDPCSAQVAFRHFCLRKKSRDRAGALLSTSRQANHRQQYSNEPGSDGASTELSDRSFRGPQATHARLPSLRLLSLSKHRGAGGEIVKRDLRGLAGAIDPAAQSVQDSRGQSPFSRRGWPRQSSFYGHMRHYRAASHCEEMTSEKGMKRHSRNCCRPGQVGTFRG